MSAGGLNPVTGSGARELLLGREQELDQLDQMMDRLGTRGGALVVRGEAGIGKSTLLNAVGERAREQGATVITTTGTQSETRFTFGGLHQLLQPFLDRKYQLPDPQRRALDVAFGVAEGDPPDVFLVALATLSLLTESASTTPLLLIVDDAHWLDQRSAEALTFVARRLDMEVLILLFAIREGMPSAFDEADLPELRLDGLSGEASRALLETNGAGLTDELQNRILAEAVGNPLALIELPKSAAALDPALPWPPLPLTARLEAAFTARLRALDADVRTLLLLAALDDREVAELSRAAEDLLNTRIYLSDWTRAVASGCGTLLDNKYRFRHPLIRSAVQQSASDPQRRQAHAALARTLAGDPDRAVWHRAAAADGPDERVAEALVLAADRAESRGGHDVAFQALERAAALTTAPAQRAIRLQRAGEIAMYQGRSDESVAILREALNLGLSADDTVRTSFNLETMTSAWSGASAIPRFAEIAKDIAATGDGPKALDRLLLVSMRAFWGPLDDSTRQEVSTIVADLTVPLDDPQRVSALALIDPVHRGREVIDLIGDLSPVGIVDPLDLMGIGTAANAVWADDLALPFLRSAVSGLRADGRMHLLGQALVSEAWADVNRGAVRLAVVGAAEGARICEETGAVRYVLVANLARAIAAAGLGDEKTAEQLISGAESALLPMGANPLLSLVALARGRLALASERPREAYADLIRIFTVGDAAFQPFVRGWALADLVDATLHGGGDVDLVRGFLFEWQEIATDTRAPHLVVQLDYAAAVLADDAVAEKLFGVAMRSAVDGWPFYVARAQLAYGQCLRRQHRDVDSRVPLREAAQAFEALGQMRYADRALRELRASGERARRRVPEAWTELSPQELQIAQLAADGLSNREIGQRLYLSHRTIGTHLYNLFPKLGITSRANCVVLLRVRAIPDLGRARRRPTDDRGSVDRAGRLLDRGDRELPLLRLHQVGRLR